jgi:hypothetical protein
VERGLKARNRDRGGGVERINGAVGSLIGVIAPREIAASVGPTQRNGKAAALTRGLAHDVSNLLGVGRRLGSQPHSNTSMTIMRRRNAGMGSAAHAARPV